MIRAAIAMLRARGYTLMPTDTLESMGLPMLASPSGKLLIAVGSVRSIGFRYHDGRLVADQLSLTSSLVLRMIDARNPVEVIIAAPALPIPWQADPLSDDFDSLLAFTNGVKN